MNTVQTFNSLPVSIISHDHRRWLTAEDVGRCLGFGKGNERKGIIAAYNRHVDEFTAEDSTVVKLTTVDGKQREVRIFSETGCIKLGFFANTPLAKEFRKWAAHTLSGSLNSQISADSWLIAELQDQYLAARPDMARLLGYRLKGLNRAEIGILLNISPRTVGRRIKTLQQLHILPHTPQPELITCLPASDIQASLALEV